MTDIKLGYSREELIHCEFISKIGLETWKLSWETVFWERITHWGRKLIRLQSKCLISLWKNISKIFFKNGMKMLFPIDFATGFHFSLNLKPLVYTAINCSVKRVYRFTRFRTFCILCEILLPSTWS